MNDETVQQGQMQHLSMAAAGSFVLALLGGASCLGGMIVAPSKPSLAVLVLVSPLLGLIAGVLGYIAMRRIARSDGLMVGRPLALGGLFLGLIGAVLQGAVVAGALRTWADTKSALVPVAGAFVVAAEEGRTDDARALLSEGAGAALDDDALASFAGALRSAGGPPGGASLDILGVLRAAGELRSRARPSGASGAPLPDVDARPVQIDLRDGPVLAYVFLDAGALESGSVRIADVLALPAGGADAVTLLPAGPAAQLARAMGIPVRR